MIGFNKRHFLYGFGVLIITILICAIVGALSFSTLFLDPVGQVIKSFHFTDSYFYIENNSDEISDANPDIVLYDLSGCYSRAEIAGAVQNLYDKGARAIALDVIFGGTSSHDPAANDSLMNVMARCHDKVIAACRAVPTMDGFTFESSFFAKETGCREACINVENDIVRTFSPDLCFGDTCLATFVSVITELAYPEEHKAWIEEENKSSLINYKHVFFDQWHIYDEITEDDVKDRVFLFGDFSDLRDFHSVPIEIDGSRRISGTTIHAYAITTITKNRLITQMTERTGMVLGFIFSFLFCVVCCQVTEKYDKIAGLVMNVYQLALLLILAFIGGIIFLKLRYDINLVYAMLGIGLAGFSTDLWYYITTTRLYQFLSKWVKRAPKASETNEEDINEGDNESDAEKEENDWNDENNNEIINSTNNNETGVEETTLSDTNS